MAIDPCLCLPSPQCVEMPEELAIRVELTRHPKAAHDVVGANRMDEHPLGITLAELPIVDQLVTNATARISRISEELKLISLTRFMMSRAVVGTSGRSIA